MLYEKNDIGGEGSQEYAALYTYILDDSEQLAIRKRPLVLICPGGGYQHTSDREAEIVAMQFLAMGYHAAVLRYSCAPSVYPAALLELARSVSLIRANAVKWHIDEERIIPLGFSAGGHLVANYCIEWHEEWLGSRCGVPAGMLRPNAMILGYPVITSGEYAHRDSIQNLLGAKYEEKMEKMSLEKRVTDAVPRTFIWHTCEDPSVPVQNSYLLVGALLAHHIPVEYHVFEKGGHGLSLANRLSASASGFGEEKGCQCWIELVHRWLEAG